ncbi:MAG: hypothetical protein ACOC6F_00520 [bacterium]
MSQLQDRLESITNIDHIVVGTHIPLQDCRVAPNRPLTSMVDGYAFFPGPASGLGIEFEIFIPKRIQRQLLPRDREPRARTERFRVYVRNPYCFPVTFVESICAEPGGEPSEGVIVVREFLRDAFEQSDDNGLAFDWLGPSPFHADFFLLEGTEEQAYDRRGFVCGQVPGKGYDTFVFHFDPCRYDGPTDAKDAWFREFGDELGLFYRGVHARIMRVRRWENVESLVDDLLALFRRRGLRAVLGRIVRAPGQIREATIALVEFERHDLGVAYDMQVQYADLVAIVGEPYIDRAIRAEMNNRLDYGSRQTRDIIELLESRRARAVEQGVVLLSAILGGAVGALITMAVAP